MTYFSRRDGLPHRRVCQQYGLVCLVSAWFRQDLPQYDISYLRGRQDQMDYFAPAFPPARHQLRLQALAGGDEKQKGPPVQ